MGSLWSRWHSRGLPGMWGMSQQKSWPLEMLRKGKCSSPGWWWGWASVENIPSWVPGSESSAVGPGGRYRVGGVLAPGAGDPGCPPLGLCFLSPSTSLTCFIQGLTTHCIAKNRGVWHAAAYGVAKSWTRPSDGTATRSMPVNLTRTL